MRVTHVITRLIVGGAQENTIASVLGLRQKPGMTVQLIAGPTTGPEGSLENQVATTPGLLTVVPSLVRPLDPWNDWLALHRLTRLLVEQRPTIVHTHSGKAGILGRLAAHRARVPLILHTIHGPSFGPFQRAAANFLFRSAERIAAQYTTHFVTVANAMKEQYLSAGIGRPEQFTRIFSGFPLEPFLQAKNDLALRTRLGIGPEDFVVGKIARLFKLKGHANLFAVAPELVRRCPRIKFLLVGDGLWRRRFVEQAQAMGLEKHIRFAGLIPPEEVPRYVGIMDALVHLSRREGLARALPQAMAAGKPVVAYAGDGAQEVCRENKTGFLVPAGDWTLLTTRLTELARNASLCERLGRCGQELVTASFSVEQMVNELHALYLRLAETQPRRGLAQAPDCRRPANLQP